MANQLPANRDGRGRFAREAGRASMVLGAAVALSLSAITQLRAQDEVPADPAAARQALDSKKQELDSNAAKELTIRSEVVSLSSERERLNARLIETANLIQRGEAQMTAIEGRLSELEAQERTVRGTLGERHGEIAALLAALQRMGRNPPPVLVTRREDALQMVRSAMLLASAFPDLRDQAVTLSGKLEKLQTVMASIRTEGARLKAETDRLNETRSRLASLMEVKKLTLAERQTELASVRVATAEISKSVNNLSELIGRLNTAVTEQTGLGTYNKELKAERAASELNVQTASAAPAPAPAPENPVPEALKPGPQVIRPPPLEPVPQATVEPKPVAEAKPAEAKVAILARSDAPKRSVIELAPEGTSVIPGNPGRIKPAIPFGSAKGKLPLPAQGARALAFGDRTQYGGQSKGIVIETRYGGQITSPCDGWVLYAGEFRSYGQLLIIDGGDGYLMLLAGLSQIDVQPGQFVLAAEPVGTMSVGQKNSPSSARVSGPVLYVELRKDGRPIDPDPWWASGQQKVQG